MAPLKRKKSFQCPRELILEWSHIHFRHKSIIGKNFELFAKKRCFIGDQHYLYANEWRKILNSVEINCFIWTTGQSNSIAKIMEINWSSFEILLLHVQLFIYTTYIAYSTSQHKVRVTRCGIFFPPFLCQQEDPSKTLYKSTAYSSTSMTEPLMIQHTSTILFLIISRRIIY